MLQKYVGDINTVLLSAGNLEGVSLNGFPLNYHATAVVRDYQSGSAMLAIEVDAPNAVMSYAVRFHPDSDVSYLVFTGLADEDASSGDTVQVTSCMISGPEYQMVGGRNFNEVKGNITVPRIEPVTGKKQIAGVFMFNVPSGSIMTNSYFRMHTSEEIIFNPSK